MTIAQACQKLEISEQTFHRWRNQYGGMKARVAKWLSRLWIECDINSDAIAITGIRHAQVQRT